MDRHNMMSWNKKYNIDFVMNVMFFFGLLIAAAMLQACGGADRSGTSWGTTPKGTTIPALPVDNGGATVLPAEPVDDASSSTDIDQDTGSSVDIDDTTPGDGETELVGSFVIEDRLAFVDELSAVAATIKIADDTDEEDTSHAATVLTEVRDVDGRKLACVSYAKRVAECYAGTNFDMAVLLDVEDMSSDLVNAGEEVKEACEDYAELDDARYDLVSENSVEAFIDAVDGTDGDSLADLVGKMSCADIDTITANDKAVLGLFPSLLPAMLDEDELSANSRANFFQSVRDSKFWIFSQVPEDGREILRAKIEFLNGEFDEDEQKLIVVWETNPNRDGGTINYVKWGELVVEGQGDVREFSLRSTDGNVPIKSAINSMFGHRGLAVGHIVVVDYADEIKNRKLHSSIVTNDYDSSSRLSKLINTIEIDGNDVAEAISSTHAFVFSSNSPWSLIRDSPLRWWQEHFLPGRVFCAKADRRSTDDYDFDQFEPAISNDAEADDFDGCERTVDETTTSAVLQIDLENIQQINWLGTTPLGAEPDGSPKVMRCLKLEY